MSPRPPRARRAGRGSIAALALSLAGYGLAAAQGDVVPADAGEWEVEWVAERQREAGEPAAHAVRLKLARGLAGGRELSLELERAHGGGGPRVDGLQLEAKTAVRAPPDGDPGVVLVLAASAAWQREAAGPWRGAEVVVQVEGARALGPRWGVEAAVGAAYDRLERRRRTVWSASVERTFGEPWSAHVEVDGDDREPPTATLAVQRELGDDIDLELAWHTRLGAPGEKGISLRLSLGFD